MAAPDKLKVKDALALAEKHVIQKQWRQAVAIGEQLSRQLPRFGGGWLLLFKVFTAVGDFPQLETIVDDCLEQLPRFVPAYVNKANALRMQQRQSEAIQYIEKALELEPANARVRNHLGILKKELGDFSGALAEFNRCIALEPLYADAYWNRADIFPELTRGDIDAMLKVLKNPKLKASGQASLHYAIARAYEYLGDTEEQFAHVNAGAKAKRSTLQYDHKAEIDESRRIISTFTTELCQSLAQQGSSQLQSTPVFICGLPRSGTTLVEQILTSHPEVNCGEEMTSLALATSDVLRRASINMPYPDWASKLSQAQWSAIGKRYYELTKALHSQRFFTDKNLQNYKAIGLIRLALPEAKVIFCRRNAMDNLWGCYRQLFSNGLAFTYSFEELAETYQSAQELLHHWQTLFGNKLHILDYEDLVNKQEETTKALLDYVGLEWNDACLNFHDNPRAVRTSSASQVRSPINTQRINQWQRFEEQLQALQQMLEKGVT